MIMLRTKARRRGAGAHCVVLMLTIVLVLVGCGGDDEDSGGGTATTERSEAPSETDSREQPKVEADQRIGEKAELVLEDFPTGWQQADDEEDSERSECSGISDARDATSAQAFSPRFSRVENTSAENAVYVYADEAAATDAFAGLVSSETRRCLGEEIGELLGDEERAGPGGKVEVGEPETSRVSIEPLGDEREAARITIPFQSQGIDVDVTIDAVFVRVGRGIAALVFVDVLSGFDEDLKAELTSKVVRRLSAGLD